jgi:hypothetical protein
MKPLLDYPLIYFPVTMTGSPFDHAGSKNVISNALFRRQKEDRYKFDLPIDRTETTKTLCSSPDIGRLNMFLESFPERQIGSQVTAAVF